MIVTVTSPICLKFQNDTLQRLQFRLQAIPGQVAVRSDNSTFNIARTFAGSPSTVSRAWISGDSRRQAITTIYNPSADWHLRTCVRRERMSNGRDTK